MTTLGGTSVDTADLEDLRQSVRAALADVAPLSDTAKRMESDHPWSAAAWRRLSEEVCLPGLGIAEQYGGQGFGRVEQAVALEELGAVLYSGPFLTSAVLAAGALANAAAEIMRQRWLPGIADGTLLAALALTDAERSQVRATGSARTRTVNGTARAVPGASDASLFLVPALGPDGPELVAVERSAAVEVVPVSVLDLTRPLARVTFTAADATPLTTAADAAQTLHAVRNLAASAFASEQVGSARAALDMTIEFARQRVQFGREIGSFQAVRHRLADLYAEVELATAAARAAAAVPDLTSNDADITIATAQSMANETLMTVSEQTVQLHGGIGFTWEHPAHLYFKRAKSSELLLGGAERARLRLLDALTASRRPPGAINEGMRELS
jgi:alkylation response protein AidB-like acyl-CoA dehydrogenase